MRVIVVGIAGESYAVPMSDVREVVTGPLLTPLPGAPDAVAGLLNVRGEVIPVVDGHALVGAVRHAGGHDRRSAVVVDTRLGAVAIVFDGVAGTAELQQLIQPSERPGCRGVYGTGSGIAALLHLEPALARVGQLLPEDAR